MSIGFRYSEEERSAAVSSFSGQVQSVIKVLVENENDLSGGYEYYASYDEDRELELVMDTLKAVAEEIIAALAGKDPQT